MKGRLVSGEKEAEKSEIWGLPGGGKRGNSVRKGIQDKVAFPLEVFAGFSTVPCGCHHASEP